MKTLNKQSTAINEMLNDFDFMDKLNDKQRNEIFIASVSENSKISLKIINKWEKHNGFNYDHTGRVDEVAKSFGILY